MASAWSQQELDRLRKRFEELGRMAEQSQSAADHDHVSKPAPAEAPADGKIEDAFATLRREAEALKGRIEGEREQSAADAERAETAAALVARPAEAEAPAPVPVDPQAAVAGALERVLGALSPRDAAAAGRVLARVVAVFDSVRDVRVRAAAQGRILGWFDATARALKDAGDEEALERFAHDVHGALKGTAVLRDHPLGAVLREVDEGVRAARAAATAAAAAPKAAEADEEKPQARTLAERIVARLKGRVEGVDRIIATRMVAFALEARAQTFSARFEDRLLGSNLTILDRFESAIKLPAKFFDFDDRFKLASAIFPDGVAPVGTDGEALEGSLGKFAWLLGADIAPKEGYAGLTTEDEALEFAEAAARDAGGDPDALAGGGALGDMGAFPSIAGLDPSAMGGLGLGLGGIREIPGRVKPSPIDVSLASAAARGGAGGTPAAPKLAAMPGLPAAAARLPAAALRAIQTGNLPALNLALGGGVAMPQLRAIMMSPAFASIRPVPTMGGMGSLSHVAMGFQSHASAQARDTGLRSLDRLSFGGLGGSARGGLGYVGALSTSYLPRLAATSLDFGRGFAGAPAPRIPAAQAPAVAAKLMPAVARSFGLGGGAGAMPAMTMGPLSAPPMGRTPAAPGGYAPMAMPTYAGGLKLDMARAMASPGAQASFAGSLPALAAPGATLPSYTRPAAMSASAVRSAAEWRAARATTLPAFAISSDSFGVPRYRGAKALPAAAMSAVGGFDPSGSVVLGGGSRAAAASTTGGYRPGAAFKGLGLPGLGAAAAPFRGFGGGLGALPGIKPFTYTQDDFGITRIESARRMAPAAPAIQLGAVDLGARGGFDLSALDMAGGLTAIPAGAARAPAAGRKLSWMDRLRFGAGGAGGAGGASGAGAATLGSGARSFAGFDAATMIGAPTAASAPSSLALGPIELAFPAGAAAPAARAPAARAPALADLALGEPALVAAAPQPQAPQPQAPAGLAFDPTLSMSKEQMAAAGTFEAAARRLGLAIPKAAARVPASQVKRSMAGPVLALGPAFKRAGAGRTAAKIDLGSAPADLAASANLVARRPAALDKYSAPVAAIQDNYSGARMWRGGAAVASVEAAEVVLPGAAAPRAGRAAPRLEAVYGAAHGAAVARASDPLALARHGGIEAAHAATLVNKRYSTLGMDAEVAPVVARLTRRGERLDSLTASRLEASIGTLPQNLRVARGPEAEAAAEALGTPGFAAGSTVVLGKGVRPDTREGMRVLGHEARHAQVESRRAPSAGRPQPVHRFIDKIDAPGESDARAAGDAAARRAPPAGEGVVFGLVPRSVKGRFSDRFALDGWQKGDIRYSAGRLDAGLKLRESTRSLDLTVDHDFVRFPGDITQVPAAAIPVDLTSQLAEGDSIRARRVADGRSMGLVFAPRGYEMPLRGLLWGRPGSGRAARGGVQFREVQFQNRFAAVDPVRVEGGLAVEGEEGTLPGAFRLERGDAGSGGRPGPFAERAPRDVRGTAGSVSAERGDVKIGARFGETRVSAGARGEFRGDLVEGAALARLAPAGRVERLPRSEDFLQASGLDIDRSGKVIEQNRKVADATRAAYVRRGGLPNSSEWALSVSVDEAAASDPALDVRFKRARGEAAAIAVEPDSALGRRIRSTRGQPLSSPVLDFMETFFRRDLSGVRVSEGPAARAMNEELKSDAFAVGQDVYVGTPRSESDRVSTIGHEIAHTIESPRRAAPAPRPRTSPSAIDRSLASAQERKARDAEKQIAALIRREPKVRRTPKMAMTHTKVSHEELAAAEKSPVQKKTTGKAADAPVQMLEGKTGSLLPKPWEALFPRPPKRDLTPLVYQIWNKIKKELAIDMERRSGGF